MTITRGVFDLFFAPGEVAEIRALGCSGKHKAWGNKFCSSVGGGPVAGYFDNDADFAQRAAELDTAGPAAVYFTINPVLPDLLARAVCRLKPNPKSTTNDADVVCLRWLYVDLDPKRPAGISATDAELAVALEVARAIVARLEQQMGFARAVRAESGNGYHLLYRIPDLAPTDENKELLRSCLKALAALHSTPEVEVDEKNFNPARICKLYGTTARKGDSTPERPHRPSRLRAGNPAVLADVPITPIEKIKALAAMAPPDEKKAQKQTGSNTAPTPIVQNSGSGAVSKNGKTANALGPLNVTAYLEHYGIAVHSVKSRNGAVYFCLEECLFDANHRGGEAMICQSPTAPFLTYQCFHNSCRHKRWQDARLVISGNDAVAQFCEGYDPDWDRRRAEPNALAEHCVVPTLPISAPATAAEPPVPPPPEMDPAKFFERGSKGREIFVPKYMANYFHMLYGPIVHTDGVFWRYENGVWRVFNKSSLFSAGIVALAERAKPEWVDAAVRTLAGVINKEEECWEDAGNFINCANGMIDLDRLRGDLEHCLLPHDPKYGSRTQVPCKFDVDADYDAWLKFVFDVFPGDFDQGLPKHDVLRQFFGYCLLADCRFAKSLWLYGTGANGKSTAMGVLEAMVGRENTSTLTITDLSQRFKTQFLQNKLVNIATETNTRDPVSTEIFKAAVAGDPLTAEHKYGESYTFRPYAKFVLAMNDTPVVPDKSFGFERRIIVLNFPRRFLPEEIDPDLPMKLEQCKDGVFLWALMGLQELLSQRGFTTSAAVDREKAQFMQALHPLLCFAEECLFWREDAYVHTKTLYEKYKDWCHEGGNRAFSRNKFYDQILINFPQIEKKPWGDRRLPHFVGVGLRLED